MGEVIMEIMRIMMHINTLCRAWHMRTLPQIRSFLITSITLPDSCFYWTACWKRGGDLSTNISTSNFLVSIPLNISAVATRSSTSPSSRGYIREMARAHWVHAPTYVGWHRAARVSARRRSSRKQLPALFRRNRLGNFHSFCPRPVRETHRYRLHWKETTYLHLYSSGREQGEGVSGVYFFFFGSLRACHSFINTCVSSSITWISLIGLANYNLIVRSVYET